MANPPPVFDHIGVRYQNTKSAGPHITLSAGYDRWKITKEAARKLHHALGGALAVHDRQFPYSVDAEVVGL